MRANQRGRSRPLLDRAGSDLSFSGLKTAVRRARDRLVAAQGGITRTYRADLATSGGVTPTWWKLTLGPLPRGIRLQRALGRLTGTPITTGSYLVGFEVKDGLKATSRKLFRIVVRRGSSTSLNARSRA